MDDSLSYGEMLRDERLRLSPDEIRAAELHGEGRTPLQIARALWPDDVQDAEGAKPRERRRLIFDLERRVRWMLDRVANQAHKHYGEELSQAGAEFSRVVIGAVRNRTEDGPKGAPLVGLFPRYARAEFSSYAQYREFVTDPENYVDVSVRSPIADRSVVRQSRVSNLRCLAQGLGREPANTL